MKWPREERGQGNLNRHQKAVDSTVVRYLAAPWRRGAVTSIRKLVENRLEEAKRANKIPDPPDSKQLREWLDTQGLSDIVDVLLQGESNIGISLERALIAEAAGGIFCTRPTISHWQMIGQIIRNDPVAQRVLVDLVKRRTSKRPNLCEGIRKIARTIVQRFEQDLDRSANRNDHETISEIHRQWKAKPDLNEIWFGLHMLDYSDHSRRDWYIFDLLLELDTGFAVELIEELNEPYQPALILRFGALDPSRRFSDWLRLMEAALPAFEADGAWNGRVLLPLLLLAAQDAISSGQGNRNESHDAPLAEFVEEVASALWARSDGGAATLRWGGWLFRSTMSALESERVPSPHDTNGRAHPAWLTTQALMRSPASTVWLDLRPTDVAAKDELCLEAVRILAAQEHDRSVPGRNLLFQMLPNKPEDFLEGKNGRRRRELPSLFVTWGKRADAFGTRVLAAALLDKDVAATFTDLWHRTLILREIAGHSHTFQPDENTYCDYARQASETIHFIIALGINLID